VAKFAKLFALTFVILACVAAPAFAQEAEAETTAVSSMGDNALISFSGAFGVALTVIGAAMGIGKLASAALESMARQPEVAGSIQTAMIIAAALIEGFTFYALFICSTMNPWG
jgi:F-type H+-transporting ATPase subunit c